MPSPTTTMGTTTVCHQQGNIVDGSNHSNNTTVGGAQQQPQKSFTIEGPPEVSADHQQTSSICAQDGGSLPREVPVLDCTSPPFGSPILHGTHRRFPAARFPEDSEVELKPDEQQQEKTRQQRPLSECCSWVSSPTSPPVLSPREDIDLRMQKNSFESEEQLKRFYRMEAEQHHNTTQNMSRAAREKSLYILLGEVRRYQKSFRQTTSCPEAARPTSPQPDELALTALDVVEEGNYSMIRSDIRDLMHHPVVHSPRGSKKKTVELKDNYEYTMNELALLHLWNPPVSSPPNSRAPRSPVPASVTTSPGGFTDKTS